MLQGMKAKIGKRLRLRMRVDCNYAALITKFVRSSHQSSALKWSEFGPVQSAARGPFKTLRYYVNVFVDSCDLVCRSRFQSGEIGHDDVSSAPLGRSIDHCLPSYERTSRFAHTAPNQSSIRGHCSRFASQRPLQRILIYIT